MFLIVVRNAHGKVVQRIQVSSSLATAVIRQSYEAIGWSTLVVPK